MLTLHARIAKTLGWSERQVKTFSLPSLRELVALSDRKLADEITAAIHDDAYITKRAR